MAKIILSINAGSSSVKISVYSVSSSERNPQQLAETQIDGLTAPPPKLKYLRGTETIAKDKQINQKIETQDEAFKFLLDQLVTDKELSAISKKEDITHVCHRVVHGGDYAEPKIINPDTYHHLEALTDLAPLHNASALEIVKSCMSVLPSANNIAYFDSQFHQSIPEHIRTYPITQDIAKKNGLRKYGFHGISYAFITRSVASYLGKREEDTSLIALHLGSGASACAVKNGKSWDTSMGLTPLAGLPGATRSGDIDPSLVFHYASNVGALSPSSTSSLHITQAETILNKQAGWKSLTGTTDFGKIVSSQDTDPNAKLAFDIFIDRICGFVAKYFVSLHGQVDALIFAGGIGEKSALLRERVVANCECLGINEIDKGKNEGRAEGKVVWDVDLSSQDTEGRRNKGVKILVCRTDEQYEMARGCAMDEELFA